MISTWSTVKIWNKAYTNYKSYHTKRLTFIDPRIHLYNLWHTLIHISFKTIDNEKQPATYFYARHMSVWLNQSHCFPKWAGFDYIYCMILIEWCYYANLRFIHKFLYFLSFFSIYNIEFLNAFWKSWYLWCSHYNNDTGPYQCNR